MLASAVERLRRIKRFFYLRPKPALHDLDTKLQRYLNFDEGFFIECGANDGYTQSNTWYLEQQRGWHGLLIEGIPTLYEQCRLRRPRSTVRHCALVSDDYEGSEVTMHYANLMSMVDGAMTEEEQRDHLDTGRPAEGNYTVTVPATTLTALLEREQVPHRIDFFSLDVEGYEASVLQGLDMSRFHPSWVLVEARDFDAVDGLLRMGGYQQSEQLTHHDFLYQWTGR